MHPKDGVEKTEYQPDRWKCPECERSGEELNSRKKCPDCDEPLRDVLS